jgi:hypothetical protein
MGIIHIGGIFPKKNDSETLLEKEKKMSNTIKVNGIEYRLEYDRSGVGHCWVDAGYDEDEASEYPTSDFGQCASALIEDDETSIKIDDRHYRWVVV